MSHFTNVQVQIKSANDIMECLTELGYQVINVKTVKGYGNTKEMVDFAVKTQGYDIGFRRNDEGVFEIVADWWGVKGVTEKAFISNLCVAYAEKKVRKFAQRKGFRLIEESAESGKQFLLVRRSYG
jgi:nitrogen regulatory protein PII